MTTSDVAPNAEAPPETGGLPLSERPHLAQPARAAERADAPTDPVAAEPAWGRAASDAQAIHNQDTVVSPRLRQMATTPVQPLRPPAGMPPRSAARNQPVARGLPAADSSTRLYMLVGVVAVLVLLALILVAVILARSGPQILASLNPTKTPTPTRRVLATATPPPTFTPALPTAVPTPAPPTATPRPAPTTLAKDVLAKVIPPEGLKLKVRKTASTNGDVLGELELNVQVTILEGPTDANNITWWKVDNGKGLVGWSAEGVEGVKYLIPVGWAK